MSTEPEPTITVAATDAGADEQRHVALGRAALYAVCGTPYPTEETSWERDQLEDAGRLLLTTLSTEGFFVGQMRVEKLQDKPSLYAKLAERHGWYAVWNGVHWLRCAKDFDGARLDLNRAHEVRHGGLTIEAASALTPSGFCSCGADAVVVVQRGGFACLNCYNLPQPVLGGIA